MRVSAESSQCSVYCVQDGCTRSLRSCKIDVSEHKSRATEVHMQKCSCLADKAGIAEWKKATVQTYHVVGRQSTCSVCKGLDVPPKHVTLEKLVLCTSRCGALIRCDHNDHTLGQACPVLQFCITCKCSRVTLLRTQESVAIGEYQKGLNMTGAAFLLCSDE